uniref:FBA_2 domain-containing protein n=1 Tax=Caenorhabditis tropicalis TaxID=1561998 RepID=A0A1I7TI25_9PELO
MTIGERIKIAITSKKMENYLKFFKKQVFVSKHDMNLRGKNSYISIEKKWKLFMSPSETENEEPNNIAYEDVKPWLNEKCTIIENTMNVFTRLQNMFSGRTTYLWIYLNEIEPTPIPNILSHPCVENLKAMYIVGGTMQRHELDAFMDWRREDATQFISFIDNKIPVDYNHPNAFQFNGVMYSDARWICLKDLLSIRNVHKLILEHSNFESQDLNKFIEYWINCRQHMIDYLRIENHRINITELMENITVLKSFRSNKEFYLIATNSTVKQRLMAVQLLDHPNQREQQKQLHFTVQSVNRPYEIIPRSNTLFAWTLEWTREYRILGRLARKRLLEERKITEEGGEESIAKELSGLEEELAAEGVQMIDGFMTVQERL